MRHSKKILATSTLVAVLAVASCGPPKVQSPVPETGGQTQYPNTQAWLNHCDANGGTALRDPQPPRPTSDPGPTFICVWP